MTSKNPKRPSASGPGAGSKRPKPARATAAAAAAAAQSEEEDAGLSLAFLWATEASVQRVDTDMLNFFIDNHSDAGMWPDLGAEPPSRFKDFAERRGAAVQVRDRMACTFIDANGARIH
jgi:hypothetical protein